MILMKIDSLVHGYLSRLIPTVEFGDIPPSDKSSVGKQPKFVNSVGKFLFLFVFKGPKTKN